MESTIVKKIKEFSKVTKILIFIFFIITTLIVAKFTSYGTIAGDDIWQIFFIENLWEEITSPDHGRYLAWLQMKILGSSLPMWLNIHPQDFINTIPAYIRGFDIALLCYSVSLFLYVGRKKTIFISCILVLTFCYYAHLVEHYNISEINNLSPHFGYQFGLMMYFVFWLILIKVSTNKPFSLKYQFGLGSICFLSALNDTFAITGIISLFIYILMMFIFAKKTIIENKQILIPIITFLIGAFLAIYGMIKDSHVVNFMVDFQTISFISYSINLVKEFVLQYTKFIIIDHIYFHLVIIAFIALLIYKKYINNLISKTILIAAISMYLGIQGFFLSLITGGTNTFYQKGLFWIAHNDLQIFLQMTLLCVSLLLIGEYIKYEKNKYLKSIPVIIGLFSAVFIFTPIKISYYNYLNMYKESIGARVQAYIGEKIYLFYAYQNKEAYLPINLLAYSHIASSFWVGKMFDEDYCSMYEINVKNPDWEDYDRVLTKIKSFTFDAHYVNRYIAQIYKGKVQHIIPFYFIETEKAMEEFNKAGGVITEEELQKPIFKKLYDKDFVLNKK